MPTPEEVAAAQRMDHRENKNKPKPIKHSTEDNTQAKLNDPDPTLTMDIFTLREQPMPIEKIEQIAFRMMRWVTSKEKAKEIIIDDFLYQEGYSDGNFRQLRKRCPKLEEVYQFSKMAIGNFRERKALYNEMNATMVSKSMPMYSKRWKKLYEWQASLQQKKPDTTGEKYIVINQVHSSDIVPTLKKDEDE